MWSFGRHSSHGSPQKKGRESKLVTPWGGTFISLTTEWHQTVYLIYVHQGAHLYDSDDQSSRHTICSEHSTTCVHVRHLQKDMVHKAFSLYPSLMNWWQREEDPQGNSPSPFIAIYNY